jgi:hypothetical protein
MTFGTTLIKVMIGMVGYEIYHVGERKNMENEEEQWDG